MRHNLLHFLFVLQLTLLITSCQQKKDTIAILAKADTLIYTHPDSALLVLKTIPNLKHLTEQEQANYALLLSFAQYRCYIPITSDSLINIAVQYYKDKKDADKLGMAYYVLGSIQEECNTDMETVIQSYKNAEQQASKMEDNETKSRIYSRLGYLNQTTGNYEKAKQYYRKAISIYEDSKNYYSLAYNYLNLFRIHYLSNEEDSVDWCSDILLQIEPHLTDSVLKSKIHQNIGVRYMYLGYREKAEQHLTNALKLDAKNVSIGLSLVKIYQNNNRMDKADSLCTSLSSCDDVVIKANVYKNILNGLIQESSSYIYPLFNQYVSITDSAYKQLYDSEISELQYKYDRVTLEKENIHLYNQWLFSVFIFIVVFILLTVYLLLFYHNKKKELFDLQNSLALMEEEKQILLSEKEELGHYSITKTEREERLESLSLEIKKLQHKERRLKEIIKRLNIVKERIYLDETNKPHTVYQSILQGIYHPATDRIHLRRFLNHLFYNFAERLSIQYPSLKDRDLDVCYMIALQQNIAEMAKTLNVSPDSIKRYIRKITKEMQTISQDTETLIERIEQLKKRV